MRSTCPECGSRSIATIIYGMPGPELAEAAERGEVVLGGCCVVMDGEGSLAMPDLSCRDCGTEFERPARRRPMLT